MKLDGKVAIVTGGSRGIGRAICLGLGDAGAKVVVTSRTEADRSAGTQYEKYGSGDIGDTAAQITARGGTAIPVHCDVAQVNDIQDLMTATLDHFGRIDVLVSNAGMDCEGGSIYCVTSGSARGYRQGRVGYSMSKAALERMFFSLAEEVRPHNIAVNVLDPGRVDTWMNRRGDWPGTSHIPMVQPDALAPPGVWLAGQTAETLTGALVSRAEFGVTWGPEKDKAT
ncbi:Uncharacterized oxidoreductase MexAM1_META1p0182 [Geodia barretti]|uniref:Uncharacterized oxidoreductase MexAM1_META1p0182 n=1 Tax=Geodia barretti TaxID=519541 RepID=A0AA35SGF3_GEOBA|nr:Uncharacterized oxidoreductase MexAM1_META1p0182 [Geodia barretti]